MEPGRGLSTLGTSVIYPMLPCFIGAVNACQQRHHTQALLLASNGPRKFLTTKTTNRYKATDKTLKNIPVKYTCGDFRKNCADVIFHFDFYFDDLIKMMIVL